MMWSQKIDATDVEIIRQAVKYLFSEEPYAGNPHVRFCGGADLGNWVGLPDPDNLKRISSFSLAPRALTIQDPRRMPYHTLTNFGHR